MCRRASTNFWNQIFKTFYPEVDNFLFPVGVIVVCLVQSIFFITAPKELFIYSTQIISDNNEWKWLSYRYITYMFMHQNTEHLVLNLLILVVFGVLLEVVHGYLKVLCIYFFGGVFASFVYSFFNHDVLIEGASAGTYAISLAWVSHTIWNSHVLDYPRTQYCIYTKLTFFLLVTGFLGTICCIEYIQYQGAIGTTGHFLGGITGVFTGLNFLKIVGQPKKQRHVSSESTISTISTMSAMSTICTRSTISTSTISIWN